MIGEEGRGSRGFWVIIGKEEDLKIYYQDIDIFESGQSKTLEIFELIHCTSVFMSSFLKTVIFCFFQTYKLLSLLKIKV